LGLPLELIASTEAVTGREKSQQNAKSARKCDKLIEESSCHEVSGSLLNFYATHIRLVKHVSEMKESRALGKSCDSDSIFASPQDLASDYVRKDLIEGFQNQLDTSRRDIEETLRGIYR
jgi:hypothetical protein